MQIPSNFQVYNASAGSGKTFTLVKKYLTVLLTSDDIFMFQKVLAITFTNKAAGEMKERVLENLETFSEGKTNDLLPHIIKETNLDVSTIKERSRKILDAILQNYSAFSITTIDSFTHKIIKSFAYDLGLSLNFEVEMDAVSLLNEAVDVLISKIGTDKKLTKLLIDYTLDKTDEDKSWDITRDLNEFAKILLNEDDTKHFRNLADKQLDDFTNLKGKLSTHQKALKKNLQEVGANVGALIANAGLEQKDFLRGTIPKFFNELNNETLGGKFIGRSETIDKAIENNQFYAKSKSAEITNTIDGLMPKIIVQFEESKTIYRQILMNNLALKSIIPLAVLNNINSELNHIKEDNNIRLNAEFNQLISDNIKDQPAPFIYERIGQRFMHYFIDEMQDTSELQWQNLIPLIDNALAQENSNLLLVGDGKQAIYRWRGGKAEQFIDLGITGNLGKNPFQIDKKVEELDTNYRSYSEIINFNNQFFQHTANFLQNEAYKNIYLEGTKQKENTKKGGYVSLEFLEKLEDKEEKKLQYPTKVLETIQNLQQNNFSLGEICVLTRTKKDGIEIADFLSEKEVAIVSSETLLLNNDVKIKFIINMLQILQNMNDEETKFEILYFLHEHLKIKEEKHQFIQTYLKYDNLLLFTYLEKYNIRFDLSYFFQLPFYEKVETIIRSFNLIETSDAYIQFFLDVVLEQQRKETSIQEFLDFWDLKKDKLSIVAPESTDAVQIMTIHKSKGLEFPVVIFPCDVDIYRQINPKVWLDSLPETYQFKELLIDFKKDLGFINSRGLEIYNQQRQALELDNFNLLYVALTRAVEQLYVITDYKISAKGEENTNFYAGIFINFLKKQNLWNTDKLHYNFGNLERASKKETKVNLTEEHQKFIATPWQEHNIVLLASSSKLWNTEQGKAIDFGNLLHEIFAKIRIAKDVTFVVTNFYNQGFIKKEDLEFIKRIVLAVVNHQQLKKYYTEDVLIYNEREIVDVDNQVIIPDRLVFNQHKELTIIDYKTGAPSNEHHQQLLKYEKVLKTMGFVVKEKLLLYIGEELEIALV